MDILNLIPYIYGKLIIFILVMTRVSALFSTFVLFRRDYINARIIISLSTIIAFYVLMLTPIKPVSYDIFSIHMLMLSVFQFFIGFIAGFILNIVFEIFTAFGQIISTQVGLGLASLIDPRLGSITPLSQFYMYAVILIFLMLDGHLFLIKTIIDSFSIITIDQQSIPQELLLRVLKYSAIIFSGSILLSMSIVVSIMLTNFALAVMTRFAPQFNLFSVGINMTLIIGLICIFVTFNLFVEKSSSIFNEGLMFLKQAVEMIK
jgi:flagellar biosynthesis protein FliR